MIGHRMILVDVSNYIHKSFWYNNHYYLACHPYDIIHSIPRSAVYFTIIHIIDVYKVWLIINYNTNLHSFFDLVNTCVLLFILIQIILLYHIYTWIGGRNILCDIVSSVFWCHTTNSVPELIDNNSCSIKRTYIHVWHGFKYMSPIFSAGNGYTPL